MRGLGKRIDILEQRSDGLVIPASVRRWLGETLTDDEQRVADEEQQADTGDTGPSSWSGFPAHLREWLSERSSNHEA